MRLTSYERDSLRSAVLQYLPGAEVYLYGSRVDDTKRGGDIDLLAIADSRPDFRLRIKILAEMYDRIGEQRIDLIVEERGSLRSFASMVLDEAIPL